MNYDPKIEVIGSGKNFHKGCYVLLSQITRLELPKWKGPIKNGWQQKLVQMDKDDYWRIEIRTPPLPPKYSYDFDPNYLAIILTPTEAYEWLSREGYDIPDDLAKLNPTGTEQNTVPAISIQNSNVILGDVHQPENLQVGDNARIYKQEKTEEKKKGIFSRIPYWIYLLVSFLAALFACIHYWPEIHQKFQFLFSH